MRRPLDPRAWLLWMAAASFPLLIGRNPFVMAAVLFAVLGVRAVWGTTPRFASWRIVVRLALVLASVSVVFNLLTVHAGDLVLAELPPELPLVGGILTVNALVYGLLSGVALVTLVLIGTTIAAVLDWMTLLRLLPPRLTMVSVAGSVAWAMVPRTLAAFTEIREAQMARGHRPRGVRGLLPLLVPLLAGGLERSFLLAEALEARGFGAQAAVTPGLDWWRGVLLALTLSAAVIAAYLLALGKVALAGGLAVAGIAALIASTRRPGAAPPPAPRTRYREAVWGAPEWTISLAAIAVLLLQIGVLAVDPAAFGYNPYPTLTPPPVNLGLLAGLALLLAPATVSP